MIWAVSILGTLIWFALCSMYAQLKRIADAMEKPKVEVGGRNIENLNDWRK